MTTNWAALLSTFSPSDPDSQLSSQAWPSGIIEVLGSLCPLLRVSGAGNPASAIDPLAHV